MQTAVEALEKLRNEFTEDQWCKGSFALNKENQVTKPWKDDACKWCLWGKLINVTTQDDEYLKALNYLTEAVITKGFWGVGAFNDATRTTWNDVVDIVDLSISIARSYKDE